MLDRNSNGRLFEFIAALVIMLTVPLIACAPGIPAADGPKIIIRHSDETLTQIGENKPEPGNVYLMLTVDIENAGYGVFSTNSERFFVTINHITYGQALITFPGEMRGFGLSSGQRQISKLAFEVPETFSMWGYEPGYSAFPERVNIEWIKEPAASSSIATPTATGTTR
jgi:hypothetical protein